MPVVWSIFDSDSLVFVSVDDELVYASFVFDDELLLWPPEKTTTKY